MGDCRDPKPRPSRPWWPWLLVLASAAAPAQNIRLGCRTLSLALDPSLDAATVERDWGRGDTVTTHAASLELRGCNGELLDRLPLPAPLARLDTTPLRGTTEPTYLVSVDLTAPFGSSSGPLTVPVQVMPLRLVPAEALDASGHRQPIQLAQTGKAAWQKAALPDADDLLSVSSQPDDGRFVTIYRRFHFTPKGWTVRVRVEPGLWEPDGGFPAPGRFR